MWKLVDRKTSRQQPPLPCPIRLLEFFVFEVLKEDQNEQADRLQALTRQAVVTFEVIEALPMMHEFIPQTQEERPIKLLVSFEVAVLSKVVPTNVPAVPK